MILDGSLPCRSLTRPAMENPAATNDVPTMQTIFDLPEGIIPETNHSFGVQGELTQAHTLLDYR